MDGSQMLQASHLVPMSAGACESQKLSETEAVEHRGLTEEE